MDIILAIISPSIALISGCLLWYFNENGKRDYQKYTAKLKLYEDLVLSIDTFTEGLDDIARRQKFNNNLSLAWMYCSSDVIEKFDIFLETTRVGNVSDEDNRREAMDKLMKAIRADMGLSPPSVKFKIWIAT
ncbi:MAG: hypothetical protein ACK4NR_01120 [Micavibrio sp.]